MENPHFIETCSSLFYREYLYDLTVLQGHFLRQLKQVID
jgi:hypothetical protein